MTRAIVPARFGHLLFAITLAGVNTAVITGIGVGWALGGRAFREPQTMAATWFHAFLSSWPIAMLLVFFFAPLVRRFVAFLTGTGNESPARRGNRLG